MDGIAIAKVKQRMLPVRQGQMGREASKRLLIGFHYFGTDGDIVV
jgi:hypothetical protein